MLGSDLIIYLEELLKSKIVTHAPLRGGSIHHTYKLTLTDDRSLFLKYSAQSSDGFFKESRGLLEIQKSASIKTPTIIHTNENFLLLEFVGPGQANDDQFYNFGTQLADMHQLSSQRFGFSEDNYIGRTRQINTWESSWIEFFIQHRLQFQVKLAQKQGAPTELATLFNKLKQKIPSLLEKSLEPPALLHGDLWGGNYLFSTQGEPFLIDPAIYYGHREAELAMTQLFGGFPPAFYRGYQDRYPLKAGHPERVDLYNLYHILNHYNLFGGHYLNQSINTIKQYL